MDKIATRPKQKHLQHKDLCSTKESPQIFGIKIVEELDNKETLAKKLKFSVSYINKLIKKRQIPFIKHGRAVRFIFNDVIAALQNGSSV